MELKLVMLFGFEVNPCTKSKKLIVESEEENGRKLFDRVSSKVAHSRERTVVHQLEHKKHKCPMYLKEFRNLQALGDHQNALKERETRGVEIQGKIDDRYCRHSFPCFGATSYATVSILCGESLISFSPLHHNQNLVFDASHVSKSVSLYPRSDRQGTCWSSWFPFLLNEEVIVKIHNINVWLRQEPDKIGS